MPTIATLTINPSIDKSVTLDHVAPDQKLRCRRPRLDPGGGGINVARAIYRLGGVAMAFYTAGGQYGDLLQTLLTDEAIDHRAIPIRDWTRENFTALEEATGQQFRFNMPGPTVEESEWQRCLDELRVLEPPPDYLVASGSLPPGVPDDFYAQVAQLGRERGSRVIIDTSGAALRQAARAGVYLLKPNLRELSQLAGRELDDEVEQEAAVHELIGSGKSEVVVVSLGSAGALLISADLHVRVRAPTVRIRSKIGAGDSMVAGITLALTRGAPLTDAVRFGVAAGAAAVMTPGTELCRREDTERLYESL